jgi:SOS-response transcriptional repressor LexA
LSPAPDRCFGNTESLGQGRAVAKEFFGYRHGGEGYTKRVECVNMICAAAPVHTFRMEPHERLRLARDARKLTVPAIARSLGVAESSVRAHMNGQNGIRPATAAQYARVLKISPEWLLYGTGQMGSDSLADEFSVPAPPSTQLMQSVKRLPVRYRVEAGPWREVEDLAVSYGEHDVPVPPRFAGFAQWLEEVVGDSMDRLIQPGRLVHVIDAIDMGYQPADGDIVVVERERAGLRERTLKQVEITGRRILLCPRSTNPRWQAPLDVSSGLREAESEITVQVVGLVIADFRVWK